MRLSHQYFRDKQLGMDGRKPHAAQWEAAKALTAEFFGLTPGEIGICSCSSEAYNLAAMALQLKTGDEVVVNDLDFPAGATPWLQPSCPASAKVWRNRSGALRVEDLVPLLSKKTRLVTVSLVSFFNGFRIGCRRSSRRCESTRASPGAGCHPGARPHSTRSFGADLIVSSTHKWILASHGGGLVGVPAGRAADWTVPAGGWFNLEDPFGANRFEKAVSKPGAAGFTVGMPNYPAVYAIRAGLDYIGRVGVAHIDTAARPLVMSCLAELKKLPVEMLTPDEPEHVAGILAFRHPKADAIHQRLLAANVHVMSHAGRLRVAIHGYNTAEDVERFLKELRTALNQV